METGHQKNAEKIFIGVCNSQGFVPSKFAWSVLLMRKTAPVQLCVSEHPWDVVRNNRIIDNFLKSDCDILVKMDIDQIYPEDYFEKMIPLVNKYKVIGPLIHDRNSVNNFMPLSFSSHNYPRLTKFDISGKSGVVEIPFPHTNLFYHREVFEKIPPPWYEASMAEDGLDRSNHVDFTFLDKIKNAGYPIYINLDVEVPHQSIMYINKNLREIWKRGISII